MIDRSTMRDTPYHPTAVIGRMAVWNTRRGDHLGQRSCVSAPIGRTYERKRSDQEAVHILREGGRPHMDDGLSAWLAGTRVALGDGRRALAASLAVEAFGDAVVPDIPEAIGHAILRVERALDAVVARGTAGGVS